MDSNRIKIVGGSVFDGGEVTFLEKSRKDKLKMGCVSSDGEDERHLSSKTSNTTNKRFKFPKTFVKDDCSTVCHISVPRKLRSAMKRSCESVSPPVPVCKKLNHVAAGVELLRKDVSMKSKLKMKESEAQGCVTDGTQGPVTKDEEEVAEALYALAGVFSSVGKTDKARSSGQELGANSSNLTKAENLVTPIDEIAIGKVEEEIKTVSYRDEAPNCLSNPVRSSVMLDCQNDTTQPGISVGKQACIELGSDIPEVDLPLTALDSEQRQTIQNAICDSVVSSDWTELSKTRSKFPSLEKSLASVKYPTTASAPVATACSQAEVQLTIKEAINNGSSLRPDLSSAISCVSQELGISSQSHIANLPAWLESRSCSAQSPELKRSVIAKKDAEVAISSKNSWKRCTAHVYISRLIKVFQITESKNRSMMHSTELTTNEAPKQVAHLTAIDLTGGRNSTIAVDCSDSFSGSAPEKYGTEVINAILFHKRLIQDQQQASTPYEVYSAQNQSLDFLSLPDGSGQLETSNGIGNGLEISTELRFRNLLSQNQPPIPFPVPQNCYSSTSFPSHPSLAVMQKVQLPPYVCSTSYGPTLMDATASSVEQLGQQQQKQASLLMAHYKSGVPSPTIPNKQTEGTDLPPVFQHVQTLFPPSLSSLEVLGPRYAPLLQQQQYQQLMPATSPSPSPTVKGQYHHLPSVYEANAGSPSPSTVKGQYHHLPSVYEANVGGVRSDNVPLRIICNQYI